MQLMAMMRLFKGNWNDGAILVISQRDVEFDVVDNAGALIAEMGGVDPAGKSSSFNREVNSDCLLMMVLVVRLVLVYDGAMLALFTAWGVLNLMLRDTANLQLRRLLVLVMVLVD